jgi:hypothetical protein
VRLQEEAGQDPSFEAWLAATSGLPISETAIPASGHLNGQGNVLGGARALYASATDRVLDGLESVYLLLLQEIGEDHLATTTSNTNTNTNYSASSNSFASRTTPTATGTPTSPSNVTVDTALASRHALLMLCESLWRYLPTQLREKEVFRRLAQELRPGGRLALAEETSHSNQSVGGMLRAADSASKTHTPVADGAGDGDVNTRGLDGDDRKARALLLHTIIGRRRIDVCIYLHMDILCIYAILFDMHGLRRASVGGCAALCLAATRVRM